MPSNEIDDAFEQETYEALELHSGNGKEPPPRSSWDLVDYEPVLAGNWKPAQRTVGRRTDGKGLFYPGKGHSVVSETEGGKTWFALSAASDEMHERNHVLYIDFEDDEGGVVGRLLTLGCSTDLIRGYFRYIRPTEPLDPAKAAVLRNIVTTYNPTLAVIDGITEAMVMHGLDPIDNVDAATFGRRHVVGSDELVTVDEHDENHEYEVRESQTEDDPPHGEGSGPENLGYHDSVSEDDEEQLQEH